MTNTIRTLFSISVAASLTLPGGPALAAGVALGARAVGNSPAPLGMPAVGLSAVSPSGATLSPLTSTPGSGLGTALPSANTPALAAQAAPSAALLGPRVARLSGGNATALLRRAPIAPAAAPAGASLRARLGKAVAAGKSLAPVFDGNRWGFRSAAVDSGHSYRAKPDRTSPRLGERAAFELGRDIERLYVELAEIHDMEMLLDAEGAGKDSEARRTIQRRKLSLLDGLRRLHAATPGKDYGMEAFSPASERLQDLHSRRKALRKAQARAAKKNDHGVIVRLNLKAIALHTRLLKTQVGMAIRFLIGEVPLRTKELRRNAALWSFTGAYNTAAALKAELRYRESRLLGGKKLREYLTLDSLGNPVRVFNLEGFDIEALKAPKLPAWQVKLLIAEADFLRSVYLSAELPEPGYQRIAGALEKAGRLLEKGRLRQAQQALLGIRYDLQHKRSYRVTITVRETRHSSQAKTWQRYIVPGTTLDTLLDRVGGKSRMPDLRLNEGQWMPYPRMDRGLTLGDGAVLEMSYQGSSVN